jgi:electron transport complex protein RnfB
MQYNRGGQGGGQGGGRGRKGGQGLGLGGQCYCPNCGHRQAHQRGVPCYDLRCPKCEAPLMREG